MTDPGLCDRVEAQLIELALGEERDEVLVAHASTCTGCGPRLRDLRRASALARALPRHEPPELERVLSEARSVAARGGLRAVRSEIDARPGVQASSRTTRYGGRWGLVASAALVAGIGLAHMQSRPAEAPLPVVGIEPEAVAGARPEEAAEPLGLSVDPRSGRIVAQPTVEVNLRRRSVPLTPRPTPVVDDPSAPSAHVQAAEPDAGVAGTARADDEPPTELPRVGAPAGVDGIALRRIAHSFARRGDCTRALEVYARLRAQHPADAATSLAELNAAGCRAPGE